MRRIFYVDVGDLTPEQVLEYLKRVREAYVKRTCVRFRCQD